MTKFFAGLLQAVVLYALFSFVRMDMNPSNWSENLRFVFSTVVVGCWISIFLFIPPAGRK